MKKFSPMIAFGWISTPVTMRAKYESRRGSSGIPAAIDAMSDAVKENRVDAVVGREHLEPPETARSRVARLRGGDVLTDFLKEAGHGGASRCSRAPVSSRLHVTGG